MRIVLVSNWPRSGRPVSEYAYHLVQGLAEQDEIEEIFVLADTFNGVSEQIESGKVHVLRCWDYNSKLTLFKLIGKVRELKPDLCWFNTTLGSFGASTANLPALLTPIVLQTAGVHTLVTLHNIVELTKMDEIGKTNRLVSLGAKLATWLLAQTPVCVLIPEYTAVLTEKYKARRVYTIPIGTLGKPCATVSVPDNHTLLCFGIFGTHKKLEFLLEAMAQLEKEAPWVRLRIVGGSNSHNPSYLDKLMAAYPLPNVEFVGYIPETEVLREFAQAMAVVMPYTTIGGESATLIQAGMYGKPVLISDLPFFRNRAEDYSLNFFSNDPQSIKEAILRFTTHSKDEILRQGEKNLEAATRYSMADVCRMYFELIQNLYRKEALHRGRERRSHQIRLQDLIESRRKL